MSHLKPGPKDDLGALSRFDTFHLVVSFSTRTARVAYFVRSPQTGALRMGRLLSLDAASTVVGIAIELPAMFQTLQDASHGYDTRLRYVQMPMRSFIFTWPARNSLTRAASQASCGTFDGPRGPAEHYMEGREGRADDSIAIIRGFGNSGGGESSGTD